MNRKSFNELKPLIVVLGATGTGKSKLSIELATKFNGEIINADSMQIYKGLDIVTNKVTQEEQQLVPHHLIGFLDPFYQYSVVEFQQESLEIINRLHSAGKVPVIVGGTHYYIESILWNVLIGNKKSSGNEYSGEESASVKKVDQANESEKSAGDKSSCDSESELSGNVRKTTFCSFDSYSHLSNTELHKRLNEVDPVYASTLHPNNRRKILRSLEVWEKTGQRQSDILEGMRRVEGGDGLGGGKRFTNVVLLWLNCQKDILKERLDVRVDQMLNDGLLEELKDFHDRFNAPLVKKDAAASADVQEKGEEDHYEKGIFQSIGFKEFHDYLMMKPEERETPKGQKLYSMGIKLMKQRTAKYSNRQIKWIRNRLVIRQRQSFPVYSLDASDPSNWETSVRKPAEEIINSMLDQKACPVAPVTLDVAPDSEILTGEKRRYFCEMCDRVIIGSVQWKGHLEGNKHRSMCKKRKCESELSLQTEEESKIKTV